MAIVIVCVAGVSGTFLSLRLRRAGVTESVRVTGVQALESEPPHAGDLVLVAPQVADATDRIRALSPGCRLRGLTHADVAQGGAEALAALFADELRTGTRLVGETAS